MKLSFLISRVFRSTSFSTVSGRRSDKRLRAFSRSLYAVLNTLSWGLTTLVVFFSSVMVEFYPSGVGPSRGIDFAKDAEVKQFRLKRDFLCWDGIKYSVPGITPELPRNYLDMCPALPANRFMLFQQGQDLRYVICNVNCLCNVYKCLQIISFINLGHNCVYISRKFNGRTRLNGFSETFDTFQPAFLLAFLLALIP